MDEAHHSFRPTTQAFEFFDRVLSPDLLFCATATPDDADMERLRHALDVPRFQHIAISRARVVAARLNKPRVRVVSFVARGAAPGLVDLNETALRKAVEQHRALKAALRHAGFPIVPLLLVQAASSDWTPARVRTLLRERMGFAEGAVAVHTADEPDPNIQALAHDPAVEVLVFKMAVATGFDAPRAFTLCALRSVVDPSFALQIVGRIMRVHPLLQSRSDLPPALDTGWVFLGDPAGQQGLQAADRIKAIKDSIQVATGDVAVYEGLVGEGGRIAVMDESGQSTLILDEPATVADVEPAAPAAPESEPLPLAGTLFGQLLEQQSPPPSPGGFPAAPSQQSGGVTSGGQSPQEPTATRGNAAYRYPRRPGLPVPRCLRTERMPRNIAYLLNALVRNVRFGPEHLAAALRIRADVERREKDLFDLAQQRRTQEQAVISDLFARANAHELLRVSQHLDPADVGRRLQRALADTLREAGHEVPEERDLRRALKLVLMQFPTLLKDALRRAMGACADVVDAAELPKEWQSQHELSPSPRNLYGIMPAGLNTWEQPFADWLDRDPRVLWWTRNLARPTAADDWSVRIVLPETGRGYYPDFVVCVEGRPKLDGIALAETKERTETEQAAAKSRSEHREYGRALMLSYDMPNDRFIRVEYAPDLGRNREIGPLRPDDLIVG